MFRASGFPGRMTLSPSRWHILTIKSLLLTSSIVVYQNISSISSPRLQYLGSFFIYMTSLEELAARSSWCHVIVECYMLSAAVVPNVMFSLLVHYRNLARLVTRRRNPCVLSSAPDAPLFHEIPVRMRMGLLRLFGPPPLPVDVWTYSFVGNFRLKRRGSLFCTPSEKLMNDPPFFRQAVPVNLGRKEYRNVEIKM